MLAFTLALLYPLAGLGAPVGRWQWDGTIPGSTASSVRVSLMLTGIALLFDVIVGTPVAWYPPPYVPPPGITPKQRSRPARCSRNSASLPSRSPRSRSAE